MFGNKGKWIDVEKHQGKITFSMYEFMIREEASVIIFQINDKTGERRALAKYGRNKQDVFDADVAEMKLGVTVNWPEIK